MSSMGRQSVVTFATQSSGGFMSTKVKSGKSILMWCIIGSSTFATACGQSKSKTTATAAAASVGELVPTDSSGSQGQVSLTFGAAKSGAALADDSFALAPSIAATSTVTLTTARMNIGEIKVKPSKTLSDDEKSIDEEEASEAESIKKADEAALDEQKTIKEQIKELATITDSAERAKKKTEFESKVAEFKKKRSESVKAAEEEQLEKAATRDKNMRWKGPYVYDLVSKVLSPALSPANIPDGSYERIELKLKPMRGTDTSEPLLNNSVYMNGTVTINSVARNFEVFLHQSEEIKLYGNSKVKIDASGSTNIAINFDPQGWFSGVDFSNATLNSDGTLTIDRDNNSAILAAIRKNLKKSVLFGKDVRGDGSISTAEAAGNSSADAAEKEAKEASAK